MKRFIILLAVLFTFSLYAQNKKFVEPFDIDENNFLTYQILKDTDNSKVSFLLNSRNSIYKGYIEADELQNYINLIEYSKNNGAVITENKFDYYAAYSNQYLTYAVILSVSCGAGKYNPYTAIKSETEKYTLKIGKQDIDLSREVFFNLADYLRNIQNAVKGDN